MKKAFIISLAFVFVTTGTFAEQKLKKQEKPSTRSTNQTSGVQLKDSLPNSVIEEWHITAQPNNITVTTNPPSLLWSSEKRKTKKEVLYKVSLSQNMDFPKNTTMESKEQQFCFFNPHQKLEVGKWYWKYEIISEGKITTKGPYSFIIDSNAIVFETPTFDKFLANIKKEHPRVMTQGRDIKQIRKEAPSHNIYKSIIAAGEKAFKAPVYRGSVIGKTPAEERALNIIGGKEIDIYHRLLESYVLLENKQILDKLKERLDVLLTWPTDDLLGSETLIVLAESYDTFFDILSVAEKQAILKVVDHQMKEGLSKWPGVLETRHVENHFWQKELSGNFTAALATVNDLPAANEMLEYTYEIFIARFPNLATQDGGWAEGPGYFGVNKLAIVDMALLMKKIGGVDVFKMNWYKNLADYYLYFAPIDGRISGFGDMHERVGYGNIGYEMMLVEGIENQDNKALYRLAALLKSKKAGNSKEKKLENIEPWYQIVNNIRFSPDKVEVPSNLSPLKLFSGTGEVAMHTNVLNSESDTGLYFRSSPFGAKGHMHANENCFNISRKGEPVFYSTGYYTSFSDPHSLLSYRHTRAHNGILVNGMGQAFGHEGYGWIKRYINGTNISYVCGDATMAYRPVVDEQFLQLLSKNNIKPTVANGFGDAKLKLFERHMVFLRPNTIVIYDILESEQPSEWTFLLHTMDQPELNNNLITLNTGLNYAEAYVIGSTKLNTNLTDQFFSPPVDFKKKFGVMPNQYHVSYSSETKEKGMRFMAILQLNDKGAGVEKVTEVSKGVYKVGGILIEVQMDAAKPASLSVKNGDDVLFINADITELDEKVKGEKEILSCPNIPFSKAIQ